MKVYLRHVPNPLRMRHDLMRNVRGTRSLTCPCWRRIAVSQVVLREVPAEKRRLQVETSERPMAQRINDQLKLNPVSDRTTERKSALIIVRETLTRLCRMFSNCFLHEKLFGQDRCFWR